MTPRVKHVLVAGLLCLAALSGCTEDKGASTSSTPGTAVPRQPSVSASGTPSGASSASDDSLSLPAGAKVLVPIRSGNGSGTLPTFDSSGHSYTVILSCVGKGQIHL